MKKATVIKIIHGKPVKMIVLPIMFIVTAVIVLPIMIAAFIVSLFIDI